MFRLLFQMRVLMKSSSMATRHKQPRSPGNKRIRCRLGGRTLKFLKNNPSQPFARIASGNTCKHCKVLQDSSHLEWSNPVKGEEYFGSHPPTVILKHDLSKTWYPFWKHELIKATVSRAPRVKIDNNGCASWFMALRMMRCSATAWPAPGRKHLFLQISFSSAEFTSTQLLYVAFTSKGHARIAMRPCRRGVAEVVTSLTPGTESSIVKLPAPTYSIELSCMAIMGICYAMSFQTSILFTWWDMWPSASHLLMHLEFSHYMSLSYTIVRYSVV